MKLTGLIIPILILAAACSTGSRDVSFEELDRTLELKSRLDESNFEILKSDPFAVEASFRILSSENSVPSTWHVDFAGTDIDLSELKPEDGMGISHASGRISSVYAFSEFIAPKYGQFAPVAVAHYVIPENGLDIVLLIVCFQTDPDENPSGLSVRSLDGIETSAPFAVAIDTSELKGLYFYDEYIDSGEKFSIAGRPDWDRGVLLLTRLDEDTVLSIYLPWY